MNKGKFVLLMKFVITMIAIKKFVIDVRTQNI